MAHYDVTHACGHTRDVYLEGRHERREWKLARLRQELCPDCWEQAQHAAAAERAAKERWPAWTSGTERQRQWAESLRGEMLDTLAKGYEHAAGEARYGRMHGEDSKPEDLATLYAIGRARQVAERTDAKWWIDHRFDGEHALLKTVILLGIEARPDLDPRPPTERPAVPPPAPVALKPPEWLVRPEGQPLTTTIVTLAYDPATRRLTAALPEIHETFRATLRAQDYAWDRAAGCWARVLPQSAGDPIDRLAELAHTLVAAGFVVRLWDAQAHARAVAGTYQPEQRRWVRLRTSGAYGGWLVLSWPRGDDLSVAADRLRGARFRDGVMLVPIGSADEVEEFAATYDFAISEKARAAIDELRASLAHGAVLTTPKRTRKARVSGDAAVPAGVVPPVLPVPEVVEVADELADHD